MVYKSQGLIINYIVLNIAKQEHYLGLLYIGYFRVKTLASLLFKVPFYFNYFIIKTFTTFIDRELDYNFRGL
jgi:hypothetical protein